MSAPAFLFTGCSHVVAPPRSAGGWVAVCGNQILYGNESWSGPSTVCDAELSAARSATHATLDAFPDATGLLVSTDSSDVQFAPWGVLAEGMGAALDTTGMLERCRARGVPHSVRWWPGQRPSPLACDFLMTAARALAILGRRGVALSGRTGTGQGWRSRLVTAIGEETLNRTLKSVALNHPQAARLVGVPRKRVDALVAAGHLKAPRKGSVTFASAILLRDEAERGGFTSWPPDDFGQAHLERLGRTAGNRLFVGLHLHGHALGLAVGGEDAEGATVVPERFALDPTRDAYRGAMPVVLDSLARTIDGLATGGCVDVVTTDPWLAKLLSGQMASTDEVAVALSGLMATASARSVVLRPQAIKEDLVRRWNANEPMGLLAASMAAAKTAAIHAPRPIRANKVHGPGGLLDLSTSGLAARADQSTRDRQAAVTAALFDLVPHERAARDRFRALAEAVHAAYRGKGAVLRPVLPGPVDGGIGIAGQGGAQACGDSYLIGPDLQARWDTWRQDYDVLVSRNPVLGFREAVLRLNPATGPTAFSDDRMGEIRLWIEGNGACPFDVSAHRQATAERELPILVAACGGWARLVTPGEYRTAA